LISQRLSKKKFLDNLFQFFPAEGTIFPLIRSFWPASGPKTAKKREFGAFAQHPERVGRAIGAWGCLKVSFQTAPNWIKQRFCAFGRG
jgi:hypothetical protein